MCKRIQSCYETQRLGCCVHNRKLMPLQTDQPYQKYCMSSVAVVQKIAVQRGAHAVNII